MIEAIFDLLPVILAVVAIILMSRRYDLVRRRRDKVVLFLSTVAASIMIVAQLSWWSTYVLKSEMFDFTFANVLWTIFNTLVMIVFIIMSIPRHEQDNS